MYVNNKLKVRKLIVFKGFISFTVLLLLFNTYTRRFLYEVSLRLYQAAALLFVVSTWQHLKLDLSTLSTAQFPQIYIYILSGLLICSFILHVVLITFRNWPGFGTASAYIEDHEGNAIVKLIITPSRPITGKAGQYIYIWLPGLSLTSAFQGHPFVVATWPEYQPKEQTDSINLDLIIQPRRGLTQELLLSSRRTTKKYHVLLAGLYGRSISFDSFDTIILIVSGFGIVAQLPYIKDIVREYNTGNNNSRRVYIVWQVKTISRERQPRDSPNANITLRRRPSSNGIFMGGYQTTGERHFDRGYDIYSARGKDEYQILRPYKRIPRFSLSGGYF